MNRSEHPFLRVKEFLHNHEPSAKKELFAGGGYLAAYFLINIFFYRQIEHLPNLFYYTFQGSSIPSFIGFVRGMIRDSD